MFIVGLGTLRWLAILLSLHHNSWRRQMASYLSFWHSGVKVPKPGHPRTLPCRTSGRQLPRGTEKKTKKGQFRTEARSWPYKIETFPSQSRRGVCASRLLFMTVHKTMTTTRKGLLTCGTSVVGYSLRGLATASTSD